MRAYYSDHFVLPLPDGHKFPMAKYSRLRERILAEDIIAPDRLHEAPLASWEDLRLVHESAYVDAVANGTVPPDIQRRIGFPWSPPMVERARRSVGATIAAARGSACSTMWPAPTRTKGIASAGSSSPLTDCVNGTRWSSAPVAAPDFLLPFR
ncbi:MAG: hypothetical protein WC815_18285 [Vicinamibacterales bacterium]|jgi:acetoin utilization deacetylase AcuC-like enzyme